MNKKRIRMMVKLADFERKNHRILRNAEEYFRSDYIWIHLFKNLIRMTMAYCIGAGLWACYNVDSLMKKLNMMEIRGIGMKLLISYILIAVVFMLMTYLTYSIRFYQSERKLHTYRNMLEQLIMEYDREESLRTKRRATDSREKHGGTDYETTVEL